MVVTTVTRPLRADAARNRERLLEAAAQVFAAQGLGASVEDVAQTAGVGIGTLYRRFPTKEDLVAELVKDVLQRFVQRAKDAAAAPGGTGLEVYLRAAGEVQQTHRGCLPRLWASAAQPELLAEARRLMVVLLADAKAHGQVRSELTPTDVNVVLWSIRGIIESTRDAAPDAWKRHLELLLAGLRPSAQVLVNPPVTPGQMDELQGVAQT